MKAVIIERNLPFLSTHSVRELIRIRADQEITPPICEDEMDLMDAIYVPSNYPVYSALPQAIPDQPLCHEAVSIARRVRDFVQGIMKYGKAG